MTEGSGQVQTVLGPIEPGAVGFTLPHEHIYARLWDNAVVATAGWGETFGAIPMPDSILREEIEAFKNLGGRTIVDLSLPAIGRAPDKLRNISTATGINVVMGCGWYREPFYPPEDAIDHRSTDELAETLIAEIQDGVKGSGVRPGIIGEIGANTGWVTALEERAHRAAARASVATGLAITTHSSWSPVGLQQLRIFVEEGVDPNRVVIGHCDSWLDLEYYLAILEQGSCVQFDGLGCWIIGKDASKYEARMVELLVEMIDRGFVAQLLLSHDVFAAPQFRYFGGVGWTYIFETFMPKLRAAGVSEELIETMTVHNPTRLLTIS